MRAVTERTRKILINIGGFGLGILWVLKDEMENPRIFKIPQAIEFSDSELVDWNRQTGPKGSWAVDDIEIDRMNRHFRRVNNTVTSHPSRSW